MVTPYWTPKQVLDEADKRELRRALVLTALDLEMRAVLAHVEPLATCIQNDGTVFVCGVFSGVGQEWLVVTAETGAGTHDALGVTNKAYELFRPFDLQIFVGIGGSRKPDDAPLGSVVAASHVYMPYGAKEGEDGRSSRPREFVADPRLLGLAKKLRLEQQWPGRIKVPANGPQPFSKEYPTTFPPTAHVAPMVSTEAVLANPQSDLAVLIARDFGDACIVEMEGFGAMHGAHRESTPNIVIRGVSDMTEMKTPGDDKVRQPIAAAHAAGFAFELLAEYGLAFPRPRGGISATEAARATTGGSSDSTSGDPGPEPKGSSAAFILNVDGDASGISKARIEEMERAIREITGNASLSIIRVDEGSVRLVVDDPTGALAGVDFEALQSGLQEKTDAKLRGIARESDLPYLEGLEKEIRRASAGLLSWPSTLSEGERIERPELQQLLQTFEANAASTTALLGLPGSGKSSLLATLGNLLVERGLPVLGIKADFLDTEVKDEGGLQAQLGLPDKPSVILERLAAFRPVFLLIDQLDALAGYLDVRTGRLSALLNLVRRLGGIDNLHIVLSARTFEYEHDVRLRSISAESLTLELPPWSRTFEILEARGVQAAGWPADAQEVLRTPQALATYLQLNAASKSQPFVKYQAMLERLWIERVVHGVGGKNRSRLASDIANEMAELESLWLAQARFEDHQSDLEALINAGILTQQGPGASIGFTHQTVFDYALSRTFAQEQGRLSTYVLERQASLFVRPKLWSALSYLREAEPTAYASDLQAIWSAQGLRPHLRRLVLDFMGQQPDPSDLEKLLMAEALKNHASRLTAFKAIKGSEGWFQHLKDSFIANAMTENETTAGWVLEILTAAWRFAADDVSRLLESRWSSDPKNDVRMWLVLQDAPHWTDQLTTLGERVLSRTDIAPLFVDNMIATIGVDQPDKALRLLRARLDRDLEQARKSAAEIAAAAKPDFDDTANEVGWLLRNNPREPLKRLLEARNEWDSLPALAEKAPQQFLEAAWPWYLSLLKELFAVVPSRERLSYPLAYESNFRFEGETSLELPEAAILEGLKKAAEGIAATPAHFRAWLAENLEVDASPAHRLMAYAMASNPKALANDAYEYLMGDPRRLFLGSSENLISTTTRLISAVSEHWSKKQVQSFEAKIHAFKPPVPADLSDPKGKRSWWKSLRQFRLGLLRALPVDRLSKKSQETIEQERRVFPRDDMGVVYSGARMIGSIMEAEAMARASDKDIINAFKELPDATRWDHPRYWDRGGNIQLSRAFSKFAKENPGRAVSIMSAFRPEVGERAAGYALDSLSESHDPNEVSALFLDLQARGFDSEEFRSSASLAMQRILDVDLPLAEEVAQVLESWLDRPARDAISPPDDDASDIDTSEDNDEGKEEDNDSTKRSLLWGYGGLAAVPQGDFFVLEAIVHLRLRQGDFPRLRTTLNDYLSRSTDERIWRHLLRELIYLKPGENEDPSESISLFKAIFDRFPRLVGTKEAGIFLAHIHWWAPAFVRDQLALWRPVNRRIVQQGYGELVGLLAIVRPELDWPRPLLAEIEGTPEMADARAGAAQSAANLWNDVDRHAAAASLLVRLLTSGEEGVWVAVFDVFRLTDELLPNESTSTFLEAVANGFPTAPRLDLTFVVEKLQTLLPHEAPLVARMAKEIVTSYRDELGDIRTGSSAATPQLVDIAITLHRLGPATREDGTALFEQLLEVDDYSARQTLDEIDSRFRSDRLPRRPRLPRRSANRRRRRNLSAAPSA